MIKNHLQNFKYGIISLIVALLLFTIFIHKVQAAKLEVLNNASSIGDQGLRITTGIDCSIDDLVIPAGPITTDKVACDTITTTGVSAVTSAVSFTTKDLIIFNPGFSVDLGATFDISIEPFVDVPYAFVENTSPNTESSYNARFDLNLDNLSLATAEDIQHFTGFAADNSVQFQLLLRRAGAANHLVLVYRDGGVLVEHGTTIILPAGVNGILVHWKSGNGNGEFQVTLNEGAPIGDTTIANNTGRIDSVKWGLVDGPVVVTTTGSIDQDDFSSFR